MALTDDGLVREQSNSGIGGVQRIYRWGDYGLSVINSPMAHAFPFAWEAAVLRFEGHGYNLTYDTPLSSDVEVFASDEETNAFIAKAKAWAESVVATVVDDA